MTGQIRKCLPCTQPQICHHDHSASVSHSPEIWQQEWNLELHRERKRGREGGRERERGEGEKERASA